MGETIAGIVCLIIGYLVGSLVSERSATDFLLMLLGLLGVWWINRRCSKLSDKMNKMEITLISLKRMEKTLEEIRAQPEQEKRRQIFEKAEPLTLKQVRLWQKPHVELIESRIGGGFRFVEYKHHHLDESITTNEATPTLTESQRRALDRHRRRHHLDDATATLLDKGLRTYNAFGRHRLEPHEQEQKLEKLNEGLSGPDQKLLLEEAEQWEPYEFTVSDSESVRAGVWEIRFLWRY
jgi:hypothetical protein